MAIDNTRSADAIERDIKRTQNSISDTVEELQERFSPRSLMNSVLGDNADGADQLVTAAKTNPLAVALIGAGALMLASGRTGSSLRDGFSSLTDRFGQSNNRGVPARPEDPYHRSYLAHMNSVEHRDNEDADSYRRRRDVARANYFMLERGHDEDETTFRGRLDQAGEALRQRTSSFGDTVSAGGHRVSDGVSSAAGAVGDAASSAAGTISDATSSAASSIADGSRRYGAKAERAYEQNPMVGGLIAAAVGAILGAVIPETEYEDEMLGEYGQQARSTAADYADAAKAKAADLAEQGKDKAAAAAETALNKADSKLDEAAQAGVAGGTTGDASISGGSDTGNTSVNTTTTSGTTYRDPAAKI